MSNFNVLDAYGSVITIQSSTFGSAERQVVQAYINALPSVSAVIANTPSVNALIQSSVITVPQISSILAVPVGSVIALIQSPSIVGTYSEDAGHTSADKGLFTLGVRNDAVASFTSADLEYAPHATDSAGRTLNKPFAPEESRVEGIAVLTSTSVTTMVAAAGAGLKNYITDIAIANTGSVTTLVTFKDGAGSILGYTIAPATGGSNMIGFATPIRTGANATFDILPASPTSTLYATVKGFKAP